MTKIWTRDAVLELLQRSDDAVKKAIRQLAARADELGAEDVGFITDIARKLPLYRDNMTPRQLGRARKILPAYADQLLEEIEAKGGVVDRAAKSLNREAADSLADHLAMKAAFAAHEAQQEAAAMESKMRSRWGIF
jgi:hypothetical protein